VKLSPAGSDIVQSVEYDNLGRPAKNCLPYAVTANGAFQDNVLNSVTSWYSANSACLQKTAINDLDRPFTESFYEEALNRATGQCAPGSRSANSSVQYFANTANEVKRYDYNLANNTISQNGSYAAATLTMTQNTDETRYCTRIRPGS
jgi:hypothetical protein